MNWLLYLCRVPSNPMNGFCFFSVATTLSSFSVLTCMPTNCKRSASCSAVRCGFSRGRLAATEMFSRRKGRLDVLRWPCGTRALRLISFQRTSRWLSAFLMSFLRVTSMRNIIARVNVGWRPRVSTRPRLYTLPFGSSLDVGQVRRLDLFVCTLCGQASVDLDRRQASLLLLVDEVQLSGGEMRRHAAREPPTEQRQTNST